VHSAVYFSAVYPTGSNEEGDTVFAQVFQGRAKEATALWNRMEEWDRTIKPITTGFLGSTAGVSDEGEFIAIARFESEDIARRNSDRPEQGEWWAETEKHLENVRFYDCTEVETVFDGGSDDAGFVQVIQGRLQNEDSKSRWRLAEADAQGWLRQNRPDLIGGIRAWQGLDFSDFIFFTSEEEARIGEQKSPPADLGGGPEEWMSQVEDLKFIDLKKPYFSSP
jgi:hypothetical protein